MPKRNWPALLKHIRAIITDISPTITWQLTSQSYIIPIIQYFSNNLLIMILLGKNLSIKYFKSISYFLNGRLESYVSKVRDTSWEYGLLRILVHSYISHSQRVKK